MTDAQDILPGCQGVASAGWVWFVAPRMDGDEVLDGASEDTHGRTEFGVSVSGVAVGTGGWRVGERPCPGPCSRHLV